MSNKITIESVNYYDFPVVGKEFANVIYSKSGKRYAAAVEICYFTSDVYIPKQAKNRVQDGFYQAFKDYIFNKKK